MQKLLSRLGKYEDRISALEARLVESGSKAGGKDVKKKSIKEFILEMKPKNDVEKTLVIGHYLEQYGGMESFNTDDLKKGFRAAKETLPGNVNDKVNLNIKAGYIMEAEEKKESKKASKKAWVLTNKGEMFVAAGLKKE